jgi:hypothetical protein
MALSNALHCLAISSSLTRLLVRMPEMLLGLATLIGGFMSHNLKSKLMLDVYPCTVANLRKSLFLKLTPVMRYLM